MKVILGCAIPFRDYCIVGEVVSEHILNYFLSVLPPLSLSEGYLQIGQPYNKGVDEYGDVKNTYATFYKNSDEQWVYCGSCFEGESTECSILLPVVYPF
jgi:hypothetical protein